MYVVLRVLHVFFLVVFLWSFQGNNAYNLVGEGAPLLTWGSFALMILTTLLAEHMRKQRKGKTAGEESETGEKMPSAKWGPWGIVAVILAAAAVLTALQFFMKL